LLVEDEGLEEKDEYVTAQHRQQAHIHADSRVEGKRSNCKKAEVAVIETSTVRFVCRYERESETPPPHLSLDEQEEMGNGIGRQRSVLLIQIN
jgi:hypothetical protein